MTANLATASYKATSAPTTRALGDHSYDMVTVKDFGAIGNGVADDTAAIQAAVDWQTSNGFRGIIRFPRGTYLISSSITFNFNGAQSIIFEGEGQASKVTGNFNDFIFTRTTTNPTGAIVIIRQLFINNDHATGGGIQINGLVSGAIRDCKITSYYGIICSEETYTIDIEACSIAATYGIQTNNHVAIRCCDITSCTEAIRCGGTDIFITGCRFEVNLTALMIGKKPTNYPTPGLTWAVQGALISACSFEANNTAIDINAAGAVTFAGLLIQLTSNAPAGMSTIGINLPGGHATYCQFQGITVSGGVTDYAMKLGNNLTGCMFNGVIANGVGKVFTNATTAVGNNVLHIAATPAWMANGLPVSNDTHSGTIPGGTTVSSFTATTITLTANVLDGGVGGVQSGDVISFGNNSADWTIPADSHAEFICSNNPYQGSEFTLISQASAPTTTQIPSGRWAMSKDTGGGSVRLYYNDSGTLKSVALSS